MSTQVATRSRQLNPNLVLTSYENNYDAKSPQGLLYLHWVMPLYWVLGPLCDASHVRFGPIREKLALPRKSFDEKLYRDKFGRQQLNVMKRPSLREVYFVVSV